MQRKLTSEHMTVLSRTRRRQGTAEMKATSLRDCVARTPTWYLGFQPGAIMALGGRQRRVVGGQAGLPSQDGGRVVEAEHGLVVFDVVAVEQLVDLLDLGVAG